MILGLYMCDWKMDKFVGWHKSETNIKEHKMGQKSEVSRYMYCVQILSLWFFVSVSLWKAHYNFTIGLWEPSILQGCTRWKGNVSNPVTLSVETIQLNYGECYWNPLMGAKNNSGFLCISLQALWQRLFMLNEVFFTIAVSKVEAETVVKY